MTTRSRAITLGFLMAAASVVALSGCGGGPGAAGSLRGHAAAGREQAVRLTYDFTATGAPDDEPYVGEVIVWSRAGERRIDLAVERAGEEIEATVISGGNGRYVCSFEPRARCTLGSDAASELEQELLRVVEAPLDLRDAAAGEDSGIDPGGASTEEFGGSTADCYEFAATAGEQPTTTKLCFAADHVVSAAEVVSEEWAASLRGTGQPAGVNDLDFVPPFAVVEVVAYPPPLLLAEIPEGKLVAGGPSDQSTIFVVDGDRTTEISPAQSYSLAPDGSVVITRSEGDELIVRTLAGAELSRMEAGSPPVWAPSNDRFATLVGDEVLIGDTKAGLLRRFAAPENTRILSWEGDGSEVMLGTIDADFTVVVSALDLRTGGRREITVLPDVTRHGGNFAPDGRFGSYFSQGSLFKHHLWVVNLETGHSCSVTESAAGALHPFPVEWSPGGRFIAYWASHNPLRDSGVIRVFDAETCADFPTTDVASQGAEWSPDGRWLAVVDEDRTKATLWSAGGTREVPATAQWIEWSPDARTIASLRGDVVGFTNVDSGAYREYEIGAEIDSAEWSPGGRYLAVGHEEIAAPEYPGASQLFVVDSRDGRVTQVWDAERGYRPIAWVAE